MFEFKLLKSFVYMLFMGLVFYTIGFVSGMTSKNPSLELKATLVTFLAIFIIFLATIFFNAFLESKNNN